MCSKYDIRKPPSWAEEQKAGVDFFLNFLKRYKYVSLRPPERTSLARMAGFNKENVKQFYDRVSEIHSRYRETRKVCEAGMTMVLKPEEIITGRG